MIHPSAIVSSKAKIHPDAYIGPWCIVEEGTIIEKNVRLESRIHVFKGTGIGENTKVYDGSVLGAPPQDLKYKGEETFLSIGKNCIIREYVTLNRGTTASFYTKIEDDVLLMAYVHVAHDCFIEKGAVISNACQLGGHVQVGKYATVGGTAGVQQKNKIGAYAFVGASLKVDKDVPPFVKALGNPLQFAGINLHALRRFPEIFLPENISEIEKFYHEIYRGKKSLTEIKEMAKKNPESELQNFFKDYEGHLIR